MKNYGKNLLFASVMLLSIASAFAAHAGKPFANQLRYWNGSSFVAIPNGKTVTCAGTTGNCTEQFDQDGNPVAGTLIMGTPTLH